jgi:tRNA(Ile2) C34 agmatinyltransferase TiaS
MKRPDRACIHVPADVTAPLQCPDCLVAAIREAENEALERAAERLDRETIAMWNTGDKVDKKCADVLDAMAEDIRSLKSTERP